MSKKITRGTAEELRFITPTGEIIKRGYAVIAAIKEEILITHSNELCAAQQKAISNLELLFPDYKISLVKEEM